MRPILQLAALSLRRAWLRSLLATMAIAFGVATLVAADLISQAVTEEIDRTEGAHTLTAFMSEQMNVGLTVVGLVVTLGAGFLTFNAFAMAVAQRREDIGRLRAAGMTRRQVQSMILTEAGAIGLLGAAGGLSLGVGLGRAVVGLVEATSDMFNRFGTGEVSSSRLAWAGGLGVLVALAAAWFPARRAVRVSPLAALRPSEADGPQHVPVGRTGLGLVSAVVLWTFLALDPPGRWIQLPWSNILTVAASVVWLACLVALLPALIEVIGRSLRGPLGLLAGTPGRLACDNLRRSRPRVVFTLLTVALGVAMIVGVTGYMTYWFDELFFRTADISLRENPGVGFFPLDVEAGMQAYTSVTSLTMPPGLRREVEAIVGDRGSLVETYFVIAPELSFLGQDYFSFVLEPDAMHQAGSLFFSFTYGTWAHAQELAELGCVVFINPTVAQKNDAWLDDVIRLLTPQGTLNCTVAGVGPTFVGASIISEEAVDAFHLPAPVNLTLYANTPEDRAAMMPELEAVANRHAGIWLLDLSVLTLIQREGMKSVQTAMDGMLFLAVLSAGLGVVNTAAIGLAERRQEMGILRAAGASRSQVHGIVLIEGLLLGLLGAVLGTLAGVGVVVLYVVISGGSPLGFADFPVWPTALACARPALERAVLGSVLAPALAALAAWLPARRALRGSVVETLASANRPW